MSKYRREKSFLFFFPSFDVANGFEWMNTKIPQIIVKKKQLIIINEDV